MKTLLTRTNRHATVILCRRFKDCVHEIQDDKSKQTTSYAGRIVEDIAARDLKHAQHPYTRALIDSMPRLDRPVDMLAVPQRDPAWLTGPTIRGSST
ncbi:ABC-type dipeptide/oligopeptide/nickel transport system ATPase component [Nitrobacteraceae bacterium AZCC 2161]